MAAAVAGPPVAFRSAARGTAREAFSKNVKNNRMVDKRELFPLPVDMSDILA